MKTATIIGVLISAAIFAQNPVTHFSGTTGSAALLAGACSSGTVTVTGANVGMEVVA